MVLRLPQVMVRLKNSSSMEEKIGSGKSKMHEQSINFEAMPPPGVGIVWY